MPLAYRHRLSDSAEVGVWRGTETHAELLDALPEQWTRRLPSHPDRARETLSARNALCTLLPGAVLHGFEKDEYGKPRLSGAPDLHFSLTHSAMAGAALVAAQPCGIDLQRRVDKITRLRSKFERADERACVSAHADEVGALHVLWGAKESLFKLWGARHIDWHEHLVVHAFDATAASGTFTGEVRKHGRVIGARLAYVWLDDSCLVTAIRDDGASASAAERH